MSELKEIQHRSNYMTDQSLVATRRMNAMLVETEHTAIQTIEKLDHQGEQLNTISQGLDHVQHDAKKARRVISQLKKSWCGFLICNCCGGCQSNSDDHYFELGKPYDKTVNSQNNWTANIGSAHAISTERGEHISRITNDVREDEMDENLNQASKQVQVLKLMARDMCTTIESQNEQIESLIHKSEKGIHLVKDDCDQTQQLLRKL